MPWRMSLAEGKWKPWLGFGLCGPAVVDVRARIRLHEHEVRDVRRKVRPMTNSSLLETGSQKLAMNEMPL